MPFFMKNVLNGLLLCTLLACASTLHAQPAQETKIRFAKIDRPGLVAEYPFSEGIVENALRARLEQAGLPKPKTTKGFTSYQGIAWPEIAPGQLDVYFNVDGKGNKSKIEFLVSKGYDNYVSSYTDAAMSANLKKFLDSLLPEIQVQQLLADIAAQEEVIRKAEREYKSMDEEGNKLTREKEQLERQIADNIVEKGKRADLLNAEKSKLDALKSGIKK
jgi:hypothetical protein